MHNILYEKESLVDQYIPISRTNLLGDITYVNDAMCSLTGYTREELIGKNHRILRCPSEKPEKYEILWNRISNGEIWEGEVKNRTKDGNIFWVHAHIHPIFDQQNNLIAYQALRENITDKKKLEFLSSHDSLTGIYNRSKFDELLDYEMEQFHRYNTTFSLAICDFDDFKTINDTYGHQVGDDVLVQSAKMIKKLIRDSDVIARWGGEEFTLLLPHTYQANANLVLEKIRQIIQNYEYKTHTKVTVSCGLSEVKNGDSITSLMKRIDDALYNSKENGKNRVSIY